MLDDETLLDITNNVFRLSIPLELYRLRNAYCPHDGSIRPGWTCPSKCQIFREYYHRGLSCNQALDRYPEECAKMMST